MLYFIFGMAAGVALGSLIAQSVYRETIQKLKDMVLYTKKEP